MMNPTIRLSRFLSAPLLAVLLALPAAAGEKGQRLEITTKEGVTAPDAQAIFHVLLGDQETAGTRQVRLMRTAAGSTLQVDVTGVTLPADTAAKLKAMFPLLKDATITLAALDVPAPAELDAESDPAKIKAMVEKKLAAEGKTGTVNVKVVEKDGKREVKVTIEAEAPSN
jgi:hypothetical protein